MSCVQQQALQNCVIYMHITNKITLNHFQLPVHQFLVVGMDMDFIWGYDVKTEASCQSGKKWTVTLYEE
jgi:hypothetical protein